MEEVLEEEEEEEYVVEKVLDRRVVKGKEEYLLKWKGFSDEENILGARREPRLPWPHCWVSAVTKNTRQINQKEASTKLILIRKIRGRRANQRRKKKKESEKPQGCGWGLKPEWITGDTDSSGEFMFLMKWTLMRMTWSLPKEANVKCAQVVVPFYEERLTWHSYPSEDDNKTMTRINSLEYQPLSHPTVGFKRGKKEFYLSWHHKGGLRRCPLKSQYSFCALQQPKGFKAVPCCTVCIPIPVEGKEGQCFKATCSELCLRKKQRASYEGQNAEWDMGEQETL